jgi:hypothetical protein
MPSFFLSVSKTAELFGASRYKAFSQGALLSSYKGITTDSKYEMGACSGITHALVADHMKSHDLFAFLDELEKDLSALSAFRFDTKELTQAIREEILRIKDKVLHILHAQDCHGTLPLCWEKDLSLYRLNRADDSPIKSQGKWQEKIKTMLLTSINGYIPLVYPVCDKRGSLNYHIILLSCMIERGVLQFVYFDPDEGLLVWDDISKYFLYLDARLPTIFESSQRIYEQGKIPEEDHRIQAVNYSAQDTFFSSEVCLWIEESLKKPSQRENLIALCQNCSFEAYLQLYNKEPVLTRTLLTEFPELKQNLRTFIETAKLEYVETELDADLYDSVDSIKYASDYRALAELMLVDPSLSNAVINLFVRSPKKISSLLMYPPLREMLGKTKYLIISNQALREAWADAVSSDPQLQKTPIYNSLFEMMMSGMSAAQSLSLFSKSLGFDVTHQGKEDEISPATFLKTSFSSTKPL